MTAPTLAEALRDLEICANTVDRCYSHNPGNFAVALRELRDSAERARAALETDDAASGQPASVADGWVLVPREPTVEMLRAEDEALPSREDEDTNPWAWGRASWAAFLAAAPQPPKEPRE